jgi:hypothetical protein
MAEESIEVNETVLNIRIKKTKDGYKVEHWEAPTTEPPLTPDAVKIAYRVRAEELVKSDDRLDAFVASMNTPITIL